MYIWYCILAIVAGTLIPLQAGINAQLKVWLDSPWYATLVSVMVSTISIFVFCLAIGAPLPNVASLTQSPWWVWIGGIVGVVYICMVLMLAPKLGAAALVGSIVAGQLICSLLLDQFGLIGFQQHPINPARILGVILLLAGVVLIQRY